jgi:ComF family protein
MEQGAMARATAGLRRLAGRALDLVYPATCLVCERPLADANTVCAKCFSELLPITAPFCPVLGLPFEADPGPGSVSPEAIADPPPFRRARAAVVYNDPASRIVSRLKYADRPELAGFCASLMVQAGMDYWADRPVLIPVPLHLSRFVERRYNQSAELARHVARRIGTVCGADLVRRARRTRQQVGLSATARERNVAGAFSAHAAILDRLAGRSVVLIDDVYTTGSTLKALTRCLQRAGVRDIDVLSFARVVSNEAIPI